MTSLTPFGSQRPPRRSPSWTARPALNKNHLPRLGPHPGISIGVSEGVTRYQHRRARQQGRAVGARQWSCAGIQRRAAGSAPAGVRAGPGAPARSRARLGSDCCAAPGHGRLRKLRPPLAVAGRAHRAQGRARRSRSRRPRAAARVPGRAVLRVDRIDGNLHFLSTSSVFERLGPIVTRSTIWEGFRLPLLRWVGTPAKFTARFVLCRHGKLALARSTFRP